MTIKCKKCLYTSEHPLGITFNEEGICSGCIIHEEKNTLDWNKRRDDLEIIIKDYKSKIGNYDCIVPVSGGKDSYYIIHLVINILKLKPLVVNYNKYFNTKVGIDNLANLRNKFDLNLHSLNVNPETVKKITRSCLFSHGNMYWPCIAGETVFPVQTAVAKKIPLIIWGAHQGLEQVGQFSHLHNVEMTRRYRKDHDLFGFEGNDLIDNFNNLVESDLFNYEYPSFSDINKVGIRGIYLGNFFRWDPYAQHIEMVEKYKYKGQRFSRSFDTYDHADSFVYLGIHDLLKMYKHGYGKVTDQACREIRHGRLDKLTAEKMVNYYQHQEPQWINLFCKWLNVNEKSFFKILNHHRNRKFWVEEEPHIWKFKQRFTKVKDTTKCSLNFPNTDKWLGNERYINIGRGVEWPY